MANRYWVGGAGDWDAANTTNWSDTSGGTGGFSIPTSADDVFFNSASNAIAYAVDITGAANCRSLSITGPATGNLTLGGTAALSVYGSLTLPSSGFINSYTGTLSFRSTVAGNTITTNGVQFQGNVTFNGINGEWQFQDNFRVVNGKTLTFTNSILDLNNFVVSGDFLAFATSGVKGLTIGTGWFEATGSSGTVLNLLPSLASPIPVSGIPTVKVTANTASLRTIRTTSFNGFYWDVLITNGTGTLRINSQSTFRNLDFTGFTGQFLLQTNITIVNNLTLGSGMTVTPVTSAVSIITMEQIFDDSVPYDATKYITTNGVTLNCSLYIDYADAATTWVLVDDLTINVPTSASVGSDFYITSYGTPADISFDANGNNITSSGIYLEGNTSFPIYCTFTLNGGVVTITGGGFDVIRTTPDTVDFTDQSTSTIIFTNSIGSQLLDTDSTISYGQIINAGTGTLFITTNEVFSVSNTVSPSGFNFYNATPVIVSAFVVSGSAGNLVTITGNLQKSANVVAANYLSITNSVASGGATWYAGANSVDNGGNSGWIFASPAYSGSGFLLF